MPKRRLIDVDKALNDINNIGFYTGKMSDGDYCDEIVNIIQNAPVVEERKHGHWKYSNSVDGCIPYCSECLNVPKSGSISEYCPKCGAIMDEDSETRSS